MAAIIVDDELAKQYARVKNIPIEEAYKKLEENLVKEALEVDLRQQYQVLMNAFRKMQPQLQGVVLRESDVNLQLAQNKNAIQEISNRLTFERETYAKAMELLNGIVAVDAETTAKIKELEAKVAELSTPFYKRIWNKLNGLRLKSIFSPRN